MPPKAKDQDEADEQAVKGLDERIEQVSLAGGGQLVASIVAELVDCFKHIPKPYAQATSGQQQDIFRRFETLARSIVQQAAERIAAHDADRSVTCVAGDAKIGSDIKLDLKLAPIATVEDRDSAILFLSHARGRRVLVRMASADEYDTEPAHDPSQPDQADLEFADGDAVIDDEPTGEEDESEPVESEPVD